MNARRRLVIGLVLSVALVAAVTPVVVVLARPAVHGWDDTVGFAAGVGTACACIAVLLRLQAAPGPRR